MRSALCLAAMIAVAAPVAHAGGLTDMTEAERTAFNAAVRDYLIANPEVIVEAMTELQTREDRAAADRDRQMMTDNHDLIYADADDWVGGNLEGDVTLVEFMDYRCTYCHRAFQDVEELVKTDGNIRFVLKEFPILGEQSVMASKFAISIRQLYGDDAYKAAHDALFALRGEVNEESLTRLAGDLGHDAAAIFAQSRKPEVQTVIDGNYALASTMEINGTPTFVIDETMVRGYVPLDGMRQVVEGARTGN